MPEPSEEKTIVWSAALNNFIDRDTGRQVSRLEGLEHLHQTTIGGVIRFADDLNRLVPNVGDLIPQSLRLAFVETVRESTPISVNPYEVKPQEGAGYSTLFTYLDQDGHLHVGFKRSAIGETIDKEVETAKIVAQIGDDLDIDPTSDEGGSSQIEPLIQSLWHFSTE